MTWGSLHALQPLICCPALLLLNAEESTDMVRIGVFSMATSDQACHGLNLQVVVRRLDQGRARLGRQRQWTGPAQLNVGPRSVARAASRTGLPMGGSTNEDGGPSRCCFSAWCRSVLDLHGVSLGDEAQQLGSCGPRLLQTTNSRSPQGC